jgi:tetratricopeptide (TPR) repeat protein
MTIYHQTIKLFAALMTLTILVANGFAKDIEVDTDYYIKGIQYASQGKFEEAIDSFDRVWMEDPNVEEVNFRGIVEDALNGLTKRNAVICFFKGFTYFNQGKLDKTISEFSKAIEMDPAFAKAYYYRGMGYHEKNDGIKAFMDYTKAIEINPSLAVVYMNRGAMLHSKALYDEAIQDLSKAIELQQATMASIMEQGHVAIVTPDTDKFEPRKIEELMKTTRLHSKTYLSRGLAYERKGALDSALEDYNRAIEINPKDAYLYSNRGRCYAIKGLHDNALKDYNKAIEMEPQLADTYVNRGLLYINVEQDISKGCLDWSKACKLGDCNNYHKALSDGICQ